MDVGFYLGELLMQQNEVSVPGLGYFVQARISGYYDENESKFYPPYHRVQFDPQSLDDDDLAEYIAKKKNISVSSAKYFAEKYITNLKQEALIGEVAIGNLGWFYTELTLLTFKPADKIIDDTIFYGYQPISIKKLGDYGPEAERPKVELVFPPTFSTKQPEETEEEQPDTGPVIPEQPEPTKTATYPLEEEVGLSTEFVDEENETSHTTRTLLIILVVVVLLSVGVYGLYKYRPEIFKKLIFWKQHTTAIVTAVKPKITTNSITDSTNIDTADTDTANTDIAGTPVKDTMAKAVTPAVITPAARVPSAGIPPDLLMKDRFEVIVATCRDTAEANKAIKKFRAVGLNTRIVTDAPGKLLQISAGAYKTQKEAKNIAIKIINEGKATGDVYPIEIKPKL